MQTLEFRAMNTSVLLAAEGDEQVTAAIQNARRLIDESEQRFSRFLPNSEISRLNRSAGEWLSISPDLMEMLTLSLGYYEETERLFDPAVLPDLMRAGYDKTMDLIRSEGASKTIAKDSGKRIAFNALEIDQDKIRVRMPKGMQIDLGGIAKGWIVEKAATLLSQRSGACAVSAGGDILFIGEPLDGSRWTVNLEDPRDANRNLATLRVGEAAVVTSSISRRTWKQGAQTRHHIIDPRTGEPAQTDWLSVTVITPEITEAEVYAKVLLIGGEAEASRLMARRPDVAFITVGTDGLLSASQKSLEYLKDNYVHI